MNNKRVVVGVLAAMTIASAVGAESIFTNYAKHPRFTQLRSQMLVAMKTGNAAMMEQVCEAGLQMSPTDENWLYNLACSLSVQKKNDRALQILEKSIKQGFRDSEKIAGDEDFANIRELPKFKELVKLAKDLNGKPIEGKPEVSALKVVAGRAARLAETNMVWDANIGVFRALVSIDTSKAPKGETAGNYGDIYVNQDANHSALNYGKFKGMSRIDFPKSAKQYGADSNLPKTLFGGIPVYGNVSRGFHNQPFRRSLVRAAMTGFNFDGTTDMTRMSFAYLENQFWCVPAVWDHPGIGYDGKERLAPEGDVFFPAAQPYILLSAGASCSDLPFLEAAARAVASMKPETKQDLVKRGLLAPALQKLFRMSQPGVKDEKNYLTAKAHPTAFTFKNLNTNQFYRLARELKGDDVPPVAIVMMINSKEKPLPVYMAGRDYPDIKPEALYQTVCAQAFVLRAEQGKRTFMFRGMLPTAEAKNAEFTWKVVHGDAKRVKITGIEEEGGAKKGFVKVTIDRKGMTGRIDLACFVKLPNSKWSAPSFVSFSVPGQEKRLYDDKGKLISIDYTNPEKRYNDPQTCTPRPWKDTYQYGIDGKLKTVIRSIKGKEPAVFPAEEFRKLRYGITPPKDDKSAPVMIYQTQAEAEKIMAEAKAKAEKEAKEKGEKPKGEGKQPKKEAK